MRRSRAWQALIAATLVFFWRWGWRRGRQRRPPGRGAPRSDSSGGQTAAKRHAVILLFRSAGFGHAGDQKLQSLFLREFTQGLDFAARGLVSKTNGLGHACLHVCWRKGSTA